MNGPDPSRISFVWVTPPGKDLQPPKVLTEDKGSIKRVVEEGINSSSDHMTSYKNGDPSCYVYFHIWS